MSCEPGPKALRVLLVEDNQYDRQFVRQALEANARACARLTECDQGEEALRLLRRDASDFDVAVVDHVLPGVSGLELCKALLAEQVPLPLVILTGRGTEQLAVEALQAGVADYVVKDLEGRWLELLPLVLRDVVRRYTEHVTRQRVEEQLRHTTKMEAIGRLASGIAHDFNNLLTGILGHANLLKLHAKPDSPVREAAEAIETAAQRAGELTEKLLGFARKGKHEVVPVDVHGLIHDAVALLSRLLGENVRITLDLHAPAAAAMGDPTQLHQVFLNLAVNARDAMPDGGDLTLGSGITTVDEESAATPPELEPGRYLRIEVADTGSGMSPEVQERVFEPFFTTKDADGSVGLGLPMVYGIIKNHGGAIEVASEEGEGTTFTIYLPLAEAAEAAPAEAEPPTVTRGSGRLLLVDDEQVIRHVGAHMLENLGYEPVVLSSAQEAIDYYRQHGAEVDLVILDVSMPDMNGYQCFRALREIDPAVRAILSSGYTQDAKVQDAMADGICGFVQKPYRVADLSEAIQHAMGYT